MTTSSMKQVWSCGGGRQSCAIAVLIIQGKLPKPDAALIADTGREKKTTWAYYEAVLKPGLAAVGVDLVRVKAEDYSYTGTRLTNNKGTMLLPAFTTETNGDVAKLPNFCSTAWKVDVVNRYCSSVLGWPPRLRCHWLGYSTDEPKRYLKKKLGADYQRGRLRFPLVDDVPTTAQQAVDLVVAHGWPPPSSSACWMCPNQRDDEWLALSEDEFAQAVAFEKEMQATDPHAWLHRSAVALDQVQFKRDSQQQRQCDSGHCFL